MAPRFTVTGLGEGSPRVEKRGPEDALAREAAALAIVAGAPWAPAVLGRAPGLLVSSRMPGAPRALAGVSPREAHRLGSVLRAAHEARRAGEGGPWWWAEPATTLEGYRAGRARDAEEALAGTAHAGLAARAAAVPAPRARAEPDPFRLLHGDLAEGNIVWDGPSPALVDWEFSRMGDPSEDLAYLVEVNAAPPSVAAALLRGYGAPGMSGRVDAWRALVALDAAAWYLAHGMAADAAPLLARATRLDAARVSPGPG